MQCRSWVSENSTDKERRILIIVLIINAGMFFAEFGAGCAESFYGLVSEFARYACRCSSLCWPISVFLLRHDSECLAHGRVWYRGRTHDCWVILYSAVKVISDNVTVLGWTASGKRHWLLYSCAWRYDDTHSLFL